MDDTMRLWGVINWSTNYPRGARLEGYNQNLEDRNVELTYQKNGKTIKLSMNKQNRAVDNLRVLYLAVEAMRLNEKRGIGEVLESAYRQLASPMQEQTPWEILGILPGSVLMVAEAAYKSKALSYHPDRGGSNEKMQILNKAIQAIREGKA